MTVRPGPASADAEYVVPLPVFKDAKGKTLVAAQSELVALSDTLFLLLAATATTATA